MTQLAIGSSRTVTVGDEGTIAIASNGGFFNYSGTTGLGVPFSNAFGPEPARHVIGPFKEGGTVTINNVSVNALDIDAKPLDVGGPIQSMVAQAATAWDVNTASDLGDSYRENGYSFDGGTGVLIYHNSRGPLPALNAVLGMPWRKIIPRCKSGTTSAQWLASDPSVMTNGGLAQALLDNSFDVPVAFPTNDVVNLVPSSTTIANLTAIYDALRLAGKRPWPTLGGIVVGWSAAQIALADAINSACLSYAQRNNLPWLDDRTVCDPGLRLLTSTWTFDNLHPNGPGWLRAALAQKARLLPFVTVALLKMSRLTALNANPSLTGGATPTSWSVSTTNAGAPTRAAVVGSEGGWQTTFTAAAANGFDGLTLTASLASLGLAVGDNVQMIVSGRILSATGGVQPRAYLTFTGGAYQARGNSRGTGPNDANTLWLTDPGQNSFVVATPVTPVPASTTSLVPLATLEADNGAVITAILTSIQVVKVS